MGRGENSVDLVLTLNNSDRQIILNYIFSTKSYYSGKINKRKLHNLNQDKIL